MSEPVIREFIASDGYRLRFRHWSVPKPQGIVIALHGIQSHSGWYEESSQRIANAGLSVYFADRRGSGMNDVQRGHAAHAQRLINDVRSLTQLARNDLAAQPGTRLPVTLLGISWGGKIATATAALFPSEFDRLALLCPGLEPRFGPTRWQRFKLKFAKDFEIVRQHIPIPLDDPALFTHDPKWQKFISDDPLALHTVTSSFLNAGLELDQLLATMASRIHHPTLLMLAGKDHIIDNDRVRRRVMTFGSGHVTTLMYQNACHTLEFEPNRESIFADLTDWLRRDLSSA